VAAEAEAGTGEQECFDRVVAKPSVGDGWKKVALPKGVCATQVTGGVGYEAGPGLVSADGRFAKYSDSGLGEFARTEADLHTPLPAGVGIEWARTYYGVYFGLSDGRASGCAEPWRDEEIEVELFTPPCWTSSGTELPPGTRYTSMAGGPAPRYALLRSDGVIVLVDAVRAAAGEQDVFTEVRAAGGQRFVKLMSSGTAYYMALDSAGKLSDDSLEPSMRTGGTSMSHENVAAADGARYVDMVDSRFRTYLLRDDGVVVSFFLGGSSETWSPEGMRVVKFGPDSYLPLAFTKDGSAFSILSRVFDLKYGFDDDLVVPDVGARWKIAGGAADDSLTLLGLVKAPKSAKKHPTAVYAPPNTDYGTVDLPLKGRGKVELALMGVGDMKGGRVVVKYKGKVLGRATVAGKSRTVKVSIPVSGLPKDKVVKLKAQFLGTKTAKKSVSTTVQAMKRSG
jgi:hypothetical protein